MVISQVIITLIIILLIGTIVSWKEMVYAFRSNFALSNKSLVLLPEDLFREAWYPFLNMYFPYFHHLDATGKEQFRKRLIQNLRDLEIIGKEGMEVNDEMRILLCASLTQLTFGMKKQGLRGYRMIHVYPASFYARQFDGYTDSVTYTNNLIALSWIHFEKGILNPEDGNNVGLTEFAYALTQTLKNGERFELKFASYIDAWIRVIKDNKHAEKFYAYIGIAGNSEDDILPHTVSKFFEKPYELKQLFPDIFAHLCLLLNQNPLNITGNYQYQKSSFSAQQIRPELPEKVAPLYKYHTWHWSYNLFIIIPFIAPFLVTYYICQEHVLNYNDLIIILLATAAVTTLLTFRLNSKHMLFGSVSRLAAFHLFCTGPLVIVFMLWFNDLGTFSGSTAEVHDISEITLVYEHNKKSRYATDYEFRFADGFLDEYPFSRRLDALEVDAGVLRNASVRFSIERGLLGFRHITSKELIYTSSNNY
jgi:MtfA peptidase